MKLSDYRMATNRLRIAKIHAVNNETPHVKTLIFKDMLCAEAEPGQFVMVWIPGIDEIPMSISNAFPNGLSSITVADVGEATHALHQRKAGEIVGLRGPFGSSFSLTSDKALIVGGGTGIAPLAFLSEKLAETSKEFTFLLGAKTKEELLFVERIENTASKAGKQARVVATTEDGSYGVRGLVTEAAEQIMARESFGVIYTCGPEQMMYKMFILGEKHKTSIQASLERLMRCTIGLCGTCAIGKYRACQDGPVFYSEQIREFKDEFSRLKRDFDGRKIPV